MQKGETYGWRLQYQLLRPMIVKERSVFTEWDRVEVTADTYIG